MKESREESGSLASTHKNESTKGTGNSETLTKILHGSVSKLRVSSPKPASKTTIQPPKKGINLFYTDQNISPRAELDKTLQDSKTLEQQFLDQIGRKRSKSQSENLAFRRNMRESIPEIDEELERLNKEAEIKRKEEESHKISKQLEIKYKELNELALHNFVADLSVGVKKDAPAAEKMLKAYRQNDFAMMEECFKKEGINIIIEEGKTLLHFAARDNNFAMLDFLLAKGFNPTIQDCSGSLPLHYAVKNHDRKIVTLLLWRKDKCISNALVKDNASLPNSLGCIARDYLSNKNADFFNLDRLLDNAEGKARDLSHEICEQVKGSFQSLLEKKQQLVDNYKKNDVALLADELKLISEIVEVIKNVSVIIKDSILTNPEKIDYLNKLHSFCKTLSDDINSEKVKNQKTSRTRAESLSRLTKPVLHFGLSVKTIQRENSKEEVDNHSSPKPISK